MQQYIKMKIILLYLLLLFTCCAKAPIKINGTGRPVTINKPGSPPVVINGPVYKDVYAIMGQSNADGQACFTGLTGSNTYLKDSMSIGGYKAYIQNYSYPGAFSTMWAGHNTSESFCLFGVQPRLAYNLLTYRPKDYYFIQSAIGSQAIIKFADSAVLFEYFMTKWNDFKTQATAEGKTARLVALIWIQGESDKATYATTYKSKVEDLILRTRTRTNQPNAKFVIVQALLNQHCTADPQMDVLGQIQYEVAQEPGNYLVPYVAGDTTGADNCHYSVQTYINKSDQIFAIIKDMGSN